MRKKIIKRDITISAPVSLNNSYKFMYVKNFLLVRDLNNRGSIQNHIFAIRCPSNQIASKYKGFLKSQKTLCTIGYMNYNTCLSGHLHSAVTSINDQFSLKPINFSMKSVLIFSPLNGHLTLWSAATQFSQMT